MSSDNLTDVLAHFDPQAWINDNAVTIDVPDGADDTWPLSDEDFAAAGTFLGVRPRRTLHPINYRPADRRVPQLATPPR